MSLIAYTQKKKDPLSERKEGQQSDTHEVPRTGEWVNHAINQPIDSTRKDHTHKPELYRSSKLKKEIWKRANWQRGSVIGGSS